MRLVFKDEILDWKEIASRLKLSPDMAPVLKRKWKSCIYVDMKKPQKTGGCVKYSDQEDQILTIGMKKNYSSKRMLEFLPGRSEYSVDARRRRSRIRKET